jgi:hypothetical protein
MEATYYHFILNLVDVKFLTKETGSALLKRPAADCAHGTEIIRVRPAGNALTGRFPLADKFQVNFICTILIYS